MLFPAKKQGVNMCLGIPGKITKIYDADGITMGIVKYDGALREACLSTVSDVAIGDYVMVHAGFALCKMDEEEAIETLRAFDEINEIPL